MTTNYPQHLVIEVDDHIAALLINIESAPGSGKKGQLVEDLEEVLVNSVLGPFGLSAGMLKDQDGGNITTVHNFEKGITANDSDSLRHEQWKKANDESFDRSDYERDLPKERKEYFKANTEVIDCYTGQQLEKDGRAHRDHVVSAAEVGRSSRSHLAQTHEERVNTANLEGNKVWARGSMNQSKSDNDLMVWANAPSAKDPSKTNAEAFGLDPKLTEAAYATAKATVAGAQNRAVLKKQATEFATECAKESTKLAMRRVVGLIMVDVIQGVLQDIRTLAREGVKDLDRVLHLLKGRGEKLLTSLKEKWATYLKEGLLAGLAGLLSSLITLLINSFVTTMKNMVTIIREGTLAVVQAVKVVVAPEPGMTGSDVARSVLKLLSGVAVLAIGITFEESIRKLIEATFLAPFAEPLAGILTAMATGIGSLLILFAFDQLKEAIAFRNKRLADVHRGQAVIFLEARKNLVILGEAHVLMDCVKGRMQQNLRDDRAEIHQLQALTDRKLDNYQDSVSRLAALMKGL